MSYKKLRKKNQWNLKKQLKWDFFPQRHRNYTKETEFLEWKNSLSEMVQLEKNKGKRVGKKVKKKSEKKEWKKRYYNEYCRKAQDHKTVLETLICQQIG